MTHSAVSHGTDDAGAGPSSTGTDLGRAHIPPPPPPLKSDTSATYDVYTTGDGSTDAVDSEHATTANHTTDKQQSPLAYLTTREFYITLLLGQILAITNTACSTFSTLLADRGVSLPATQTFFNYLLLTVIFTSYTIHRHGLQGWTQSFLSRGWKYLLLSLFDVQGNYFLVLAYRNTTLLSAQLINFWAIAIVVLISSTILGVHYHRPQLLGISICIAGMLLLLFSDRTPTTSPSGSAHNNLLGDLSALTGATSYGLANVLEEVLVTTAPIDEVLGQMALCGVCITALQALALGELSALRSTVWDVRVLGSWAAYTLCLAAFYCLVPLLLRRASAAFFNLSMLTMNCWGVGVGVLLFRYQVGWAYPVAFALIVAGQGVYFLGAVEGPGSGAGGGEKPWVRSYSGSGRVDTGRRGQRIGGLEASSEEDPLLLRQEHQAVAGERVSVV
ncbi:hypothetical protein ASPACDRAFT_127292 [Aspergillus aculeatus ATCC 16872]|uniref:EamA domain-containing protein n=1 Tax=Aspergillus aculeatus (strain ATCC 16872 / CBS 172.66 / WB 5094) TaxID=690307 RepID=A0A1L9WGI8_ASPA1|nr:uncharacterized protein ASPACDRAFT_127292 [Aspergillus aculeatus ATCC 16872]OJJ95276.1 hypothetical protein ASPACDRAFT_127292 [Aspergillus aculeatus ATCC 16872]